MEPWRPEAIWQAAGLDCIATNCIDTFIRGRGRTQYIQYYICTFVCFVEIELRVHSRLGWLKSPHYTCLLNWNLDNLMITLVPGKFSLDNGVIKCKLFPRLWPLGWESTGYRWTPLRKASKAELWCFLLCASELTAEQTIERMVICDAMALILTSLLWNVSATLTESKLQQNSNYVYIPYEWI